MINRRFFAAAAAVILIGSTPAFSQTKKDRTPKRTKPQLIEENSRYIAVIDSLKAEIERLSMPADTIVAEAAPLCELERQMEYTPETTDSLLNLWYVQQSINRDSVYTCYNMDSVRFKSNVPDSVYLRRIKDMNSFITLPYNDIVRNYIILYSDKMSTQMGKVLGLSRYYMPIFEEIFNEYDIPEELKAVAIIESLLNPTAVSRAGAKGMWQFMYGTAKHYGLTINSFVDERMDPVQAARAAARYFKDSYEIFGDWNLAIASYNCGAGNVNKAIRRSGGKRAFWDIYPYLPRETRGYGPAFVGALYTLNYYKEHGIVPEMVALPFAVDTVKVNRMLHFKQVNELVGIPVEDLRNLNPQYRHDIVPGNEKEYILKIPFNYSNAFIDAEDSLYTYKAEEYFNPVTIKKIKDGGDGQRIVYKVRNGDVLGKIASRHRVSVNQIKRWNNLKSNTIRVGQRLVIYTGNSAAAAAASKPEPSTSASSSKPAAKPVSSGSGAYTTYTVKNGDTLYDIAKLYPGVSAQNIMDFNGVGSKIRPGMTLKISTK